MSNYQPSSVTVESVEIESHNDKVIDITDLFISLTINESLFNPILKGTLMLGDATALFSTLPIVGQEKVKILYTRDDEEHTIEMRTTHVEKIGHVNDYSVTYTINLVQEEYLLNGITQVSQSFNGPMSTIIQTIYSDYLQSEIDAEPSFGNYSVVIPRWNPYKVIQWCTRRARNENNIPMLCFNTLYNGSQLKSLKTLFEQEPVSKFYRRKTKPNESATDAQRGDFGQFNEFMETALSIYELETGPMAEQIHKGAYASSTLLLDIASKTYQEYIFDYSAEFDRIPHLSEYTMVPDTFTVGGAPVYQSPLTVQRVFAHSQPSFDDGALTYNSDVTNITPFLNSYLNTLNNYRYRLTVNGRFDLGVGSLVDLRLLKNRLATDDDVDDMADARRSGKHIITALKHIITRKQGTYEYLINFDCARDTMEEAHDATV